MKSRLQWSPVWRFYKRRKVRFWVSSTFHILEDPTLRFAFAKTSLAPGTMLHLDQFGSRQRRGTTTDALCLHAACVRQYIMLCIIHRVYMSYTYVTYVHILYIYTHIGFRVYYTYGSYTQCNPTYVNQQTKRRRAADKKKEWHQHDQLTVSPVSLLSLLTLGHQP